MLTAIEIENFKGFGERQRIDFAPLTLFFGKNSGGKSSVFHAIAYIQQLFETKEANPSSLPSSGGRINLGGFRQAVHSHDVLAPIKFKLGIAPPEDGIPQPSELQDIDSPPEPPIPCSLIEIEIEIVFSPPNGACVSKFNVAGDGESLLTMSTRGTPASGCHTVLCEMNVQWAARHRITNTSPDGEAINWPRECQLSSVLPDSSNLPFTPYSFYTTATEIFFDHLARYAAELVRAELAELLHVGPLRDMPASDYEPTNASALHRWYSGLAAWDTLHWMPLENLNRVNEWLGQHRLKTGVHIWRQELVDITRFFRFMDEQLNIDFQKMWSRTAATPRLRFVPASHHQSSTPTALRPQDIGVGISQVLPVIVACVERQSRLLLIEQPELHLHPSLQTSLGDLLLEARNKHGDKSGQCILVETHSEHLILRMLRRIRETYDGEIQPPIVPTCRADEIAVYYFEDTSAGTKTTRLRIDNEGEFIDRWPYGFFDERSEELF